MRRLIEKLTLVSLLFLVGGGFSSCKKEEPLKDLKINFSAETYAIEQGQSIEIPFSVGNRAGAEITAEAGTDNAAYPATLSEIVKGEGTITVTAPEYILSVETITVTLTVNDEKNQRTATAAVTVTSALDASFAEITVPANCYIVSPGAMVKFPAHVGNTEQTVSFTSAELVWQDEKGMVNTIIPYASDNAVLAILNPEIEGNALVAVKDADGKILWSYHLWVTAEDPTAMPLMKWTDTSADTPVEYQMLDRYIGATSNKPGSDASNGLFYQWGRKDPFAKSSYENALKEVYDLAGTVVERIVEPVAVGNNIQNGIENPTTHYSGVSGGNYGWISNSKADLPAESLTDLWGFSSGTQTIYDPCPAGYRVPPVSAWKFYGDASLTVTKVFADDIEDNAHLLGRLFNVGGTDFWFPSQGEVPHGGAFTNGIGSTWPNGKGWSSSIDAANYRAYSSSNSPTTLAYYTGLGFGYGCPVRCIKL